MNIPAFFDTLEAISGNRPVNVMGKANHYRLYGIRHYLIFGTDKLSEKETAYQSKCCFKVFNITDANKDWYIEKYREKYKL